VPKNMDYSSVLGCGFCLWMNMQTHPMPNKILGLFWGARSQVWASARVEMADWPLPTRLRGHESHPLWVRPCFDHWRHTHRVGPSRLDGGHVSSGRRRPTQHRGNAGKQVILPRGDANGASQGPADYRFPHSSRKARSN